MKLATRRRTPAASAAATPMSAGARLDAGPAPAPTSRLPAGEQGSAVRVAVVEDDAQVRGAIVRELKSDPRIEVAGEAGSLREGLHLVASCAFDVLLLDLRLRDGLGFDLIERARRAHPGVEVIVVSVLDDDESALRAFELGATGYLIKSAWFGGFAAAVLQVMNGGAVITPSLARRLLRRLDGACYPGDRSRVARPAARQRLSAREREILQCVANGYTSCEIGKRLGISNQTVDTHLKNIFRKLEVRTRAQAVNRASEWGVLFE